MQSTPYYFFPFPLLVYLLFVTIFLLVVTLIEIGIVHYAAERLGIERRKVYALLFLSLLGSYVNIPMMRFPPERVESGQIISVFGVPYVVPVVRKWPSTVLAINVGGALVPLGLSCYLMIKNRLYAQSLGGIIAVSAVAYAFARPVHGLGISVPILIPPLAAALTGIMSSWKQSAPLAYISGTIGTLIGADLLNLDALPGLGAPVASIGGAGTFDGIFLTGIIAVLLA
jgi:uncharacterized membrane protein